MPFDPFVLLHDLLGVDGQLFVRVDHHAEQAGVSLQGETYMIIRRVVLTDVINCLSRCA